MIINIATRSTLIALILIWIIWDAAADIDIDYSHSVAGTGTVMTDFQMGSVDSTRAIGEVHGTGEVLSRYIFQSNNSENITIQDQILFTKSQASNTTGMKSYPQMKRNPGSFRLLGTAWSGRIDGINPKIN